MSVSLILSLLIRQFFSEGTVLLSLVQPPGWSPRFVAVRGSLIEAFCISHLVQPDLVLAVEVL